MTRVDPLGERPPARRARRAWPTCASQRLAAPRRRTASSSCGSSVAHARAQPGDLARHVDRRAAVADQPAHRPVEQPPDLQVDRGLRRGRHLVVQRLDRLPQRRAGRRRRGPRRRRGSRRPADAPVSSIARKTNEMPPRLTTSLTSDRGDDLAAQPVAGHPVGEALAQRGREVVGQHVGGPLLVAQRRRRGPRVSSAIFTYASSTANSGAVSPRRPRRGRPAPRRSAAPRARGRAAPDCSSSVSIRRCTGSSECGLRPGVAERRGLLVVVAQHQRGDLVGHLGQQLVAVRHGQLAVGHRAAEQDLDVDLVVGAVDAGRVVDEVGEDRRAAGAERVLDPAALGQARGCRPRRRPWPRSCAPLTRIASLALSPTSALRLGRSP